MIVVDASAVVDLLLRTERAAAVSAAIAGEEQLHAPEIAEPEVLAAFRRWLLRGWLAEAAAARAVGEFGELAIVQHPHAALRREVWALRDRCTIYDACYVALARVMEATLVTSDGPLARAAVPFVNVVAVEAP